MTLEKWVDKTATQAQIAELIRAIMIDVDIDDYEEYVKEWEHEKEYQYHS